VSFKGAPGAQYTSFQLAEHLDAAGIAASIGSVGDAYGNPRMEPILQSCSVSVLQIGSTSPKRSRCS
jgi:putative transposase